MEAPDYEVLSVREQLFHERIRECIARAVHLYPGNCPGCCPAPALLHHQQ
ncbi:LMBR1L isoform 10 [Pan troglodytes]|uniref:Limb development membrane protein 1 like n=3 Tax=Hominidae TaxID=9604 RepID=F8VPB1_HUMAN|nr:limb development membrane protein 1 like [Homo sapiens]KAI4065741.1 limb development membrane protein 1 like [Homo sapiens]PNI49354.1 LMBR1L isoform 10 [Pan troglodytes]PNJ25883.1 LMBR1L isoform 9 [Pongo abelii]